MKHDDVFNQILKNLSNFHKSENANNSSYRIEKEVITSLISLYGVLSKNSTSFDAQIQQEMAEMQLSCNCSAVRPSLSELLCMCRINQKLFYSGIHSEEDVACLVLLYISQIWLEKQPYEHSANLSENTEEFMKTSASLCQSYSCKSLKICLKKDNTHFFFLFYYFYLFLVLEKYKLIEDGYNPWSEGLVTNWIYLPLEGTINLVYFNYLITKDKAGFSKLTSYSDKEFKANEITQYDCGYITNGDQTVCLDQKEMICLFEKEIFTPGEVSRDEIKKYINYPMQWFSCFHIFSSKTEPDENTLKIIKALRDFQNYASIDGLYGYGNNNSYKILANIDECNFNVRGILYDNMFGNASTWIKSTVFRELQLSTIWHLEKIHDIVMDHLGKFVKNASFLAVDQNTNISDKKQLFSTLYRKVNNYKFSKNIIDKFKDNALIQMVAWLFLSEIYAYIKTEVIISKYMVDNADSFKKNDGYFPEKVPTNIYVILADLSLCEKNDDNRPTSICDNIEKYYKQQDIFLKEDINELIQLTKTVIFRFYGDTMVQIQGPQNCTLRQFMTVSLVLVKSQKGTNIFPKITEFKFYGHATQRLSVFKYLTDLQQRCGLKQILFASKLFERQNNIFIKTSHIKLYDKFVVDIYTKILEYLDEKIPILKTGSKTEAEKAEKQLNEKVTPYGLLMFMNDITVNLFDKLLDEMP